MAQLRSLTLGCWLCFAALCFLAPATTLAQTSKLSDSAPVSDKANDNQVVHALLEEVHLLRIVLEEKNTTVSRIQIAIERIKLQQETVIRLTKDLEETRAQLAQLKVT